MGRLHRYLYACEKGGYAGRTRPGFNGSDPLRFGDIQREMNLARKQKNQGSKRKPFLVRSRLYCRGRLTLFAFDASLLSAMLRNMLLATAEEANRMLLLLSPACAGLAGWQWELSKHFLLVRSNISQAIHWTTMPRWTFVLS